MSASQGPSPSPHPEPHTLIFSEAPGPGQEAGWSLEGGGLSDPELLKRANGEVKIGNKNKIAPASPGCLCRKQGIYGPTGRVGGRAQPPGPSQTRNVSPSLQLPPRRASKRNPENPVQTPALPPTSRVALGKEPSPPCHQWGTNPPPGYRERHHMQGSWYPTRLSARFSPRCVPLCQFPIGSLTPPPQGGSQKIRAPARVRH